MPGQLSDGGGSIRNPVAGDQEIRVELLFGAPGTGFQP